MFKFTPGQSPAAYYFKDPDTGHEFHGKDMNEIVSLVRNYRAQNDLEEIDYLAMSIEDYLCRQVENAGKCELIRLKRGWFEWVSGGLNVAKNMWLGEKNMVSQEVADKRSEVCARCPCNIFPDKDAFIEWSDKVAIASIGDRKSKHHNELGNCSVCSCPLKPKVFAKGPFELQPSQLDSMREVGCWVTGELDG